MMIFYWIYFYLFSTATCMVHRGGILYPIQTETRQIVPLDGVWNFVVASSEKPSRGFDEHWFNKSLKEIPDVDVHLMPVPSSYNDISTDSKIRDHVGLVWYERTFIPPKSLHQDGRVWLRFESVSYAAQVWINGELVMTHEIGHLPFLAEVTEYLNYGKENRISVVCDNRLLVDTVPQGKVKGNGFVQSYTFDFFNYAGIDRPVVLYTTPRTYIDDIVVTTNFNDNFGLVSYRVNYISQENKIACRVSLLDKSGKTVAINDVQGSNFGVLEVPKPNLWWPYLMNENPGYLYKLQVELIDDTGNLLDIYTLPVGIRTIRWTNTSLLINEVPAYLRGFGKHEDSDIRGKGLDLPVIIRDYNLIKWIGANAFRTSHYPYAEEIIDIADELGIMIIDECPSVDTEVFSDALLAKHKQSLTELIKRDKNRPSVIMWSVANAPKTQNPKSRDYFRQVIEHIKGMDKTRPTTIVESQSVYAVQSSNFVDIVSFNRYNGWYNEIGNLDIIPEKVFNEAQQWHKKFNKPVIMQEYGADTFEGLHSLPNSTWTEEYGVQLMSKHFEAFDNLRALGGFFVGEFISNFADFRTPLSCTHVGCDKKGIFTRNRQPKATAHHLRKRYWALASLLQNVTLPTDLYSYIATQSSKDEL